MTNTCGCGNHDKPVNPANADVREEIKIVPAEGSVDNVVAPEGHACGCGHESGQCTCGHHQTCDCPPGQCNCEGHKHTETVTTTETTETTEATGSKYDDEIGRDDVNADIDGQVTTVEQAEHHTPGQSWNDGNIPTDNDKAVGSGQTESDAENIN